MKQKVVQIYGNVFVKLLTIFFILIAYHL